MAKIDRTVFTTNDQDNGDIADPNKLEANDSHIADVVDTNDTEFNNHKSATTLDHPDKSVTELKMADNSVSRRTIVDGSVGRYQLQQDLWKETANEAKFEEIDADLAENTKNLNYIVTPEMFGAVGDGITDDTVALKDADLWAKDNNSWVVGLGSYKITSQWIIENNLLDLNKITLSDGFPDSVALLYSGDFGDKTIRHNIYIDGNRSNQTVDIIAYKAYQLRSMSTELNLVFDNCFNGLLVSGNTERIRTSVYASNTDYVVREQEEGTGDITPDETFHYISGGFNCIYLYDKNSMSASQVTFNTEAPSTPAGEHTVKVSGNTTKPTKLMGLIRGTGDGNGILVDGTSSVTFDLHIHSPSGYGLNVKKANWVSGKITMTSPSNGGVKIGQIYRPSTLETDIQSCNGNTAFIVGGVDGSPYDCTFNINISSINDDNHLLHVLDSRFCKINLSYYGNKPSTKGILLEYDSFTLNINYDIFNADIPVTLGGGYETNPMDINVFGRLADTTKITAYSTPVKGMKLYSMNHGGKLVYYNGTEWRMTSDVTLS